MTTSCRVGIPWVTVVVVAPDDAGANVGSDAETVHHLVRRIQPYPQRAVGADDFRTVAEIHSHPAMLRSTRSPMSAEIRITTRSCEHTTEEVDRDPGSRHQLNRPTVATRRNPAPAPRTGLHTPRGGTTPRRLQRRRHGNAPMADRARQHTTQQRLG